MKITDDYVYHSLISTRNAFRKLAASYFTHSATKAFIENVLMQMDDLLGRYDSIDHGQILQFIRQLNELEVYFSHSVPKNHPNEMKILLKESLSILHPEESVDILMTQQPNLSYHHKPLPLRFSDNYFIFFCIPMHHKDETLLNSILFHELGHFYDSLKPEGIVRSEMIPFELMQLNDGRIDAYSWVKEFFADYFSIQQGSIACFFSAYEALFNRCFIVEGTGESQTHPNDYFRFLIMEYLIKRNHSGFLKNTESGRMFNSFLDSCSGKFSEIIRMTDTVPTGSELYSHVKEYLISQFDEFVVPIQLSEKIDVYIQQIIHLIPPVLDEGFSPVNLLVSGWLTYYFHREELADRSGLDQNDLSEVRRVINNLVKKGILNFYLRRNWRKLDETPQL